MEALNQLRDMHEKIQVMKAAAGALREIGADFPALRCNVDRISAGLKMLEINICDLIAVEED